MISIGPYFVMNALANFAYPATYLCLLIVSLVYLRRYPKPAFCFAIANGLLLAQVVMRTLVFPIAGQMLAANQVGWVLAIVSLVATMMHVGAMMLIAVAVFSSRRAVAESSKVTVAPSKKALAAEILSEREVDFLSDDPSPYRPPGQPR